MTEITDSVLINNLYRILCLRKSRLSEFREIFEEIGILSEVENGEIRHEQIRRINEWIERNRGSNNDEIKLIECLEKFRKLSKSEGNFNEQLKVTKNVFKYLLKLLTPTQLQFSPIGGEKLASYVEKIWGYLKEAQEHALGIAEFRRDNIIHQFRVFLLGCYILYRLKRVITKCFRKDLRLICKFSDDFKRLIFGTLYEDEDEIIRITKYIKRRGRRRKKEDEILWQYIKRVKFRDILWMWLLSSLFHDIGKPIEDAVKEIKRLMNTYSIERIDIDSLVFSVAENLKVNSNKVEEFTELLEKIFNNNSNFYEQIRHFLRNRTSSEKKWDHGILSAMILYSPLTDGLSREDRFSIGNWSHYLPLYPPIIAIMLHTEPSKYIFCTSLTQLLIICDELQEWNRITAIGDKEVMIFPCKSLHLELENREMRVLIPYERPIDVISQEIFRRFDPKRRWRKIAKGNPVCRNNDLLFRKITVRILLDQTGKICTIEIHPNGINYSISHPFLIEFH